MYIALSFVEEMSDQDEALLDEELGDEDYDLGNEEEEALLADDEIDYERFSVKQNSSIIKPEEESDDILDLGVSDVLEDLIVEDDNTHSKSFLKGNGSHKTDNYVEKNKSFINSKIFKNKFSSSSSDSWKLDSRLQTISDRKEEKVQNSTKINLKHSNSNLNNDLRQKLRGKLTKPRDCLKNSYHRNNEDIEKKRNNFETKKTLATKNDNYEIIGTSENNCLSKFVEKQYETDKNRIDNYGYINRKNEARSDIYSNSRFHKSISSSPARPPVSAQRTFEITSDNKRVPPFTEQHCQRIYSGTELSPLDYNTSEINRIPLLPCYLNPGYNIFANQYSGNAQSSISQIPHHTGLPLENTIHHPRSVAPERQDFEQLSFANIQQFPLISRNQNPELHDRRLPPYDGRINDPRFEISSSVSSSDTYSRFSYTQSQQSLFPQGSQTELFVPTVDNSLNVSPIVSTGHKILINPHFKAKSDGKMASNPADKIVQELRNATTRQQIKSGDPFSYFSDVWQESRSQRQHSSTFRRSFSPENISKTVNYKKKTEGYYSHKDTHAEDPKTYREKYRDKDSCPRVKKDHKSSSPIQSSASKYDGKIIYGSEKNDNDNTSHRFEKDKMKTVTIKKNSDENVAQKIPKRMTSKSNENQKYFAASKNEKKDEEIDPDMREYQKKMEEQKQLRERIIQEKENRRKLAAMGIQKSSKLNYKEKLMREPILNAIIKDNADKQDKHVMTTEEVQQEGESNLHVSQEEVTTTCVHQQIKSSKLENNRTSMLSNQKVHNKEFDKNKNSKTKNNEDNFIQKMELRSIKYCNQSEKNIIKTRTKMMSRIVLSKAKFFKCQMNLRQRPAVNTQRQIGQIRELLANSQRIVVQGNSNHQHNQLHTTSAISKQQPIIKSQQQHIIKSKSVIVENLATNTTESIIRKMCQGIGSIESVEVKKSTARIIFKTHSAAMVFIKKYHNKVVDSSLLKVKLLPQRASTDQNPSKMYIKKTMEP